MSTVSANVWLAIILPRLSTDRLLRAGRAPDDRPLAVYAKDAGAFVLTGVDQRASALGLKRAMSLADARAIYPSLNALEAAPDEDARTLDAIAAWCERFTPVVVIDAPDGLFLDIAGCAHLFGGEAALRDQIVARLAAHGFTARAALAPTPGAAWALARYESGKRNAGGIARALSPLPVEALRLDEEAASLLRRLGLKTIGQLYDAPRSAFTARAGERAMLRLDQALGRAAEALTPRRPAPPVFALKRFLEPVFTTDHMLEATRDLCADALVDVERRGGGVRHAVLHLFGVDGRDRLIEVGVSRPERSAAALVRLFREKLAQAAENLNAEFGIEAARLDITLLQRIDATPRDLVAGGGAHASAADVAAMIDLVSARLGAKRVLRAKLNAVHAPERAGAWRAALSNADAKTPQLAIAPAEVQRRPLTLFARPQPIEAMATVPDGPPIRFRWRRVLREVARAEGPERISGDWMRAECARDYYRIEDTQGRRYWVYREGFYGEDAAPRWFVHGLFA
ncbi:MAG: DNA polymerase Y family protein [Hyphomonadaceae bacterium]|nr:DNA polymerase Y family protein [Hyphomonadaceae bacterium]